MNAQKDGVNLVCLTKVRSNPENNVGLLTLANTVEVLATLTSDVPRILSKLHLVQPKGNVNLITGIRIAHVSIGENLVTSVFRFKSFVVFCTSLLDCCLEFCYCYSFWGLDEYEKTRLQIKISVGLVIKRRKW